MSDYQSLHDAIWAATTRLRGRADALRDKAESCRDIGLETLGESLTFHANVIEEVADSLNKAWSQFLQDGHQQSLRSIAETLSTLVEKSK